MPEVVQFHPVEVGQGFSGPRIAMIDDAILFPKTAEHHGVLPAHGGEILGCRPDVGREHFILLLSHAREPGKEKDE